ncbi:MAG: CmpA/NrtA family ABC transporter substrate-binding protein [Verrucomicrobiota bacterium]
MTKEASLRRPTSSVIRLGYIRLLDAAPLIVADSLGLFRDAGLDVTLSREVGWASIRDKLAFGELDVVQALGPMPVVMQLGVGVAKTDVIAGMILNANGNAITLSNRFLDEGVDDGDSLRRYIKKGYRNRKPVFGVVSRYSSHHFLLCRWLEAHRLDPRKDVIVIVLPPEQMVRNLSSGNVDGFCVGEPWNSVAVEQGVGWCPATSVQISANYPEKVLATTGRFFAYRPDEYIRMISVIGEACEFCQEASNRKTLVKILSDPRYLNCAPKSLGHALGGKFPMGRGLFAEGGFIRFSGENVNRPDSARTGCIVADLCRYTPDINLSEPPEKIISRVYLPSIYDQANSLVVS